jgi:hypothetical protein
MKLLRNAIDDQCSVYCSVALEPSSNALFTPLTKRKAVYEVVYKELQTYLPSVADQSASHYGHFSRGAETHGVHFID